MAAVVEKVIQRSTLPPGVTERDLEIIKKAQEIAAKVRIFYQFRFNCDFWKEEEWYI